MVYDLGQPIPLIWDIQLRHSEAIDTDTVWDILWEELENSTDTFWRFNDV